MTAIALVRAPFQPIEVTEGWDKELIQLAAKLVGYNPTAVAKMEEVRVRSSNEAIFATALEKLDIQPFTVQSVKDYKAQMLKEAHMGESWRLTRYMHYSNSSGYNKAKGEDAIWKAGLSTWIPFGAAAVVCLIGYFGGYAVGWGWDGHRSVQIMKYMSLHTAGSVMALPSLAVAGWGFLMYLRHKPATAVKAEWRSTPVAKGYQGGDCNRYSDGYLEAIPPFALQRMVSLKQELPEVTFSVEELNSSKVDLNTEKALKRPPDPFLVANFRGVCAYIDVWDEPRFEGRRQV